MIYNFQMVTAQNPMWQGPSEHRSPCDCPAHTPSLYFPFIFPTSTIRRVTSCTIYGSPWPFSPVLSLTAQSPAQSSPATRAEGYTSDARRTSTKMKRTRRGSGNKAANQLQCPRRQVQNALSDWSDLPSGCPQRTEVRGSVACPRPHGDTVEGTSEPTCLSHAAG